jgi:hypothetical protein
MMLGQINHHLEIYVPALSYYCAQKKSAIVAGHLEHYERTGYSMPSFFCSCSSETPLVSGSIFQTKIA